MYRTIDARIWTDPVVRTLSVNAHFLFLYLVTNPHSHLSGIYYIPVCLIERETRLTQKQCRCCIDALSAASLAFYDDEAELVWVKNMLRYQATGPKANRAVEKQLQNYGNSRLIKDFKAYYPGFKDVKPIHPRYQTDTLSIPHRHQEQEQDQEQEQEEKTPLIPPGGSAAKRAPKDFTLTQDMMLWAARKCPGIDAALETESFRDCEFRNAHKDWPATWRNWMRTAYKRNGKQEHVARPVDPSEIPGAIVSNEKIC